MGKSPMAADRSHLHHINPALRVFGSQYRPHIHLAVVFTGFGRCFRLVLQIARVAAFLSLPPDAWSDTCCCWPMRIGSCAGDCAWFGDRKGSGFRKNRRSGWTSRRSMLPVVSACRVFGYVNGKPAWFVSEHQFFRWILLHGPSGTSPRPTVCVENRSFGGYRDMDASGTVAPTYSNWLAICWRRILALWRMSTGKAGEGFYAGDAVGLDGGLDGFKSIHWGGYRVRVR